MPTGENKALQQPPTEAEQKAKIKRIKAEVTRLWSCLDGLPDETKAVLDGLVNEAAYMRITLEDWKSELDQTGWVELFQQSEKVNPYQKKKPMAEMYLNLNPNYQKIMGKLADYMPKGEAGGKNDDDDGFDEFLNKKD